MEERAKNDSRWSKFSLMAVIKDASGNTAEKTLSEQQTFAAGETSEIDLSDLTFYVLKVGDYVYKDGTTGTSLMDKNNEYAVGKVFWLDDSDPDNSLADDPNLAKFTRGLAHQIDAAGNLPIQNSKGWGLIASNYRTYIVDKTVSDCTTTKIYGYTSTKILLEVSESMGGFVNADSAVLANIDLSTPAAQGTSPWFLPSIKEINLAVPMRTKSYWTSSLKVWYVASIGYYLGNNQCYCDPSGNLNNKDDKYTEQVAYFRVFAF